MSPARRSSCAQAIDGLLAGQAFGNGDRMQDRPCPRRWCRSRPAADAPCLNRYSPAFIRDARALDQQGDAEQQRAMSITPWVCNSSTISSESEPCCDIDHLVGRQRARRARRRGRPAPRPTPARNAGASRKVRKPDRHAEPRRLALLFRRRRRVGAGRVAARRRPWRLAPGPPGRAADAVPRRAGSDSSRIGPS